MTVYILANGVIKIYDSSIYYVPNPEAPTKGRTGWWETWCGETDCEHVICILETAKLSERSSNRQKREEAQKVKAEITEFMEHKTINGYPARQVHVDLPFVCTEMLKIIFIVVLIISFVVMIIADQPVFLYAFAVECVIWIFRLAYYYKEGGLDPSRVRYREIVNPWQ